VYRVDRPALVAAARRADCVLELVPVVGDFVSVGAPPFRVHPRPDDGAVRPAGVQALRPGELSALVAVTDERAHGEDLAYGIRKLVDIAERSIAQPFEDPTTTVQALHRLHDLLRQLASRPFPTGEHRDEDGVVRLVERTLSWDGYVLLAAAVHRAYEDEEDVSAALTPDTQGIGSGADVTKTLPRDIAAAPPLANRSPAELP
jgi:uncharacterized membrane protein